MEGPANKDSLTQRIQKLEAELEALRTEASTLGAAGVCLAADLDQQAQQLADAERTIKSKDSRYRALFAAADDAIILENDRDEIIDINQRACELLGYTREELLSMKVCDIQAPECRGEPGEILNTELADYQGQPFEALDLHKDGTRIPVEVTNTRLEEAGLFLSIVRDIRERKAHEKAQRETFDIIEKSPVVAFLWRNETDWPVEFVTANVAHLFGYSEMDIFRIENERTGEPCESPVEKVLASSQIVGLDNPTVLVDRDGQRRTIADSGAPILDSDKEIIGVVLVFRDITGQQRTEAELLKMEKLKSIGVLAGGIAHDFNNFLTGIIGNLSLAKLDATSGKPMSRYLEDMEKAAMRAKDLTQQLLTFSKGGKPVKRTTDIAELIRDAAQFALHGSNVQCKFDIDAELMAADVDEGQIAQVIHNLILNADQAMPNGGTLCIRGANVSLAQGNPFALSPGNYIQVTYEDQGTGIHPEHLKKVFDPYFTTKQKGSGLGLAVAYNINTKHNGQVTVNTKLGEGTTFTILLPATINGSKTYNEGHPFDSVTPF